MLLYILKTCFLLVSFFVLLGTTSNAMDSKKFASCIATFAAKFCNELDKNKSVVSSPLSAEFVLALLTLGASEPSHTELLNSLHISDDDQIRASFSSMSSKIKAVKGVTLNVANKVYIMDGSYDLQSSIKEDAVKIFDAEFEKLDFSNAANAASMINKWVESKTNNKIKDLLSPDSLSALTRLVLINALYFKGTWKKQFQKNLTRDLPFYVNSTNIIQVPMMHLEDKFMYGESEQLQAQLLEMHYVGEETSMLIVLPREIEGLDGIMKKLADGYDLMDEVNKMFSTKVKVSLPRFKIETEIDLKVLLPKLGIESIFVPGKSGLTKILNSPEDLYVSKAIQKAFIEVNEEGAEAAAATGMVLMMRCARPPAPEFNADRPFLYVLFGPDHNTYFIGMVLMMECIPPPAPEFNANRPFLYVLFGPDHNTYFIVMNIEYCSAIINPNPVPRFVANRPFLLVILVGNVPHFMASYRGD